jgi:hypothetical protein
MNEVKNGSSYRELSAMKQVEKMEVNENKYFPKGG